MTISSWLNFGRPAPPERGSVVGRKFLVPPYYSQHAVFASPLSTFFHFIHAAAHDTSFKKQDTVVFLQYQINVRSTTDELPGVSWQMRSCFCECWRLCISHIRLYYENTVQWDAHSMPPRRDEMKTQLLFWHCDKRPYSHVSPHGSVAWALAFERNQEKTNIITKKRI